MTDRTNAFVLGATMMFGMAVVFIVTCTTFKPSADARCKELLAHATASDTLRLAKSPTWCLIP